MTSWFKASKRNAVSRLRKFARGRESLLADAGAVALITALTVFSARNILFGGTTVGLDSATQFYPWYSFLGETLRSGELPGWNPHQFSGAPFAADPLSGWTYLPAMLLFTLLPTVAAAKSYVFLHLLMAGLAAFALARTLGMGAAGALASAVAYEFGSYFYVRNTCCFAFSSVMVWLPISILGAEMAIRSRSLLDRVLWSALSGLAVSQMLASWLGQGSYYALLALGGYVAYRALLFPPEHMRRVPGRIVGAVFVGGLVLSVGFGLAAAGLLPRLEYNALSGLAGGYEEDILPSGGSDIGDWRRLILPPSDLYVGAGALALALAAPLLARGDATRYAVPYFAALALGAITLSGEGTTWIHAALYQLPLLEQLLPYRSERFMVVFFLGVALLAGAAVSHLGERGRKGAAVSLPLLAALFIATRSTLRDSFDEPEEKPELPEEPEAWVDRAPYLLDLGVQMVPGAFFALVATAILATAYALLPSRFPVPKGILAVLLALAVFVDLNGAGVAALDMRSEEDGTLKIVERDLAEYYEPTNATRFLQSAEDPPYRYAGHAPKLGASGELAPLNINFSDIDVRRMEVSNRATAHGGNLYGVQGYNAVHLARYDEYLAAMNGRSQNYHDADVFAGGAYSRLLDLLNVRYVVLPAEAAPKDAPGPRLFDPEMSSVYVGDEVNVFENPDAMPRAWIVHSARQANPDETLDLLSSGGVDPRETALLEEPPPNLGEPENSSSDRAEITEYEANRIEAETSTDANGLLMLSEVHYPAWKAYVDGEPVEIQRANHLFRAVPVPAGDHTVELRYESWTLRAGILVSFLATVIIAGLVAVRLALRSP